MKNENLGLEKLSSACDNFHGFGSFLFKCLCKFLFVRKNHSLKEILLEKKFHKEKSERKIARKVEKFPPPIFPLAFGAWSSRTFSSRCVYLCLKRKRIFLLLLLCWWLYGILCRAWIGCTIRHRLTASTESALIFQRKFNEKVEFHRAQREMRRIFREIPSGNVESGWFLHHLAHAPSVDSRKEPFRFQSSFFFHLSRCRKHGIKERNEREKEKK